MRLIWTPDYGVRINMYIFMRMAYCFTYTCELSERRWTIYMNSCVELYDLPGDLIYIMIHKYYII